MDRIKMEEDIARLSQAIEEGARKSTSSSSTSVPSSSSLGPMPSRVGLQKPEQPKRKVKEEVMEAPPAAPAWVRRLREKTSPPQAAPTAREERLEAQAKLLAGLSRDELLGDPAQKETVGKGLLRGGLHGRWSPAKTKAAAKQKAKAKPSPKPSPKAKAKTKAKAKAKTKAKAKAVAKPNGKAAAPKAKAAAPKARADVPEEAGANDEEENVEEEEGWREGMKRNLDACRQENMAKRGQLSMGRTEKASSSALPAPPLSRGLSPTRLSHVVRPLVECGLAINKPTRNEETHTEDVMVAQVQTYLACEFCSVVTTTGRAVGTNLLHTSSTRKLRSEDANFVGFERPALSHVGDVAISLRRSALPPSLRTSSYRTGELIMWLELKACLVGNLTDGQAPGGRGGLYIWLNVNAWASCALWLIKVTWKDEMKWFLLQPGSYTKAPHRDRLLGDLRLVQLNENDGWDGVLQTLAEHFGMDVEKVQMRNGSGISAAIKDVWLQALDVQQKHPASVLLTPLALQSRDVLCTMEALTEQRLHTAPVQALDSLSLTYAMQQGFADNDDHMSKTKSGKNSGGKYHEAKKRLSSLSSEELMAELRTHVDKFSVKQALVDVLLQYDLEDDLQLVQTEE